MILLAPLLLPLWFAPGHRIVARIAERRLTPRARAEVERLLGGESLADASVWADQIRTVRRNTSRWHYVNIPLDADRYDPARDCPRGQCIIAAIDREEAVLADGHADTARRAEALRYLVHFIGDLHQPLHVVDRNDRGGNLAQVRLGGRGTNLHAVWDGAMMEEAWSDERGYLARLEEEMRGLDLAAIEKGSTVDWAMEGHALARKAYDIGGRQIDEPYLERNRPVVDLALIKAGVRLAAVLNRALDHD